MRRKPNTHTHAHMCPTHRRQVFSCQHVWLRVSSILSPTSFCDVIDTPSSSISFRLQHFHHIGCCTGDDGGSADYEMRQYFLMLKGRQWIKKRQFVTRFNVLSSFHVAGQCPPQLQRLHHRHQLAPNSQQLLPVLLWPVLRVLLP